MKQGVLNFDNLEYLTITMEEEKVEDLSNDYNSRVGFKVVNFNEYVQFNKYYLANNRI